MPEVRDTDRAGRPTRIALALSLAAFAMAADAAQPPPILDYIKQTWSVLTRSNRGLATAAVDPKFHPTADGRWPVYVAPDENLPLVEQQIRREMAHADFQKIVIRHLPREPFEQGLLYLPRPYVVPGGRFNEMYGWDSYFIQVGLLRDGELALAKDLTDNFLYEIRKYGKILNANRTYYLSRSHPPFLTEMLLAVYQRTQDKEWLAAAVPAIRQYYRYWTTEPHRTAETGLSRYFDLGDGPAPEAVSAERDAQGRTHYDLVKQYYRTHQITDYDVNQYYDPKSDQLTNLFYKGDRSMRESGFDPSDRYGPFSVDIIHYNPVCLNSLLCVMEAQTAEILRIVGRESDAAVWSQRTAARAAQVNRLMWDPQDGLYYDYDFAHKRIRRYPFLATFYPLWAGIASPEQAARIVRNLPMFERPGGLQTSTHETGQQWDAPYGWAPLQMIAVQGLRRYAYKEDADRISMRFLSLVLAEYRKQGTIVEKYDVVRRATDTGQIRFGYRSNEAGFGWTNAAFTALLDELTPDERRTLLGAATPVVQPR